MSTMRILDVIEWMNKREIEPSNDRLSIIMCSTFMSLILP